MLRWWVFADTAQPLLLTLAAGPACGLAALWCVGRALRARRARIGIRTLAGAAPYSKTSASAGFAWSEAVRAATPATSQGPGRTGDMNTWDPEVRTLLRRLTDGQHDVLSDDLLGSYVFGSLATGGFESGISDVDTVSVLRTDPTSDQLTALGRLHQVIAEEMPTWEDRVEAVYLSSRALATFRTVSSAAARIAPGEPFHAIEVDRRWLVDWYQLREVGIPLRGPSIASFVPEITHSEYVEGVRRHLLTWRDSLDDLGSQGDQAYVVLTMCRGLRTVRTGDHVSKREGAEWAAEELPEHADLIQDALEWRARSRGGRWIDGTTTRATTARFVETVLELVSQADT
jgi:hypothetical protein